MDKKKYSFYSIFHAAASSNEDFYIMIEFKKEGYGKYICIASSRIWGYCDSDDANSLRLINENNFLYNERAYLGKVYIKKRDGTKKEFADLDSFLLEINK